jgi:hypothetical protein
LTYIISPIFSVTAERNFLIVIKQVITKYLKEIRKIYGHKKNEEDKLGYYITRNVVIYTDRLVMLRTGYFISKEDGCDVDDRVSVPGRVRNSFISASRLAVGSHPVGTGSFSHEIK